MHACLKSIGSFPASLVTRLQRSSSKARALMTTLVS